MTLVQLEYVLAVAESRNFTLASEKVFVTQPTLSMQIQKLERELDVEIFDRSTHPIKITSIGKKIIDQARIILRESRNMYHVVNDSRDSLQGDFHLGIVPTVLPTLVPLFYKNFRKAFPKANLIIKEMKTEDILASLSDDTLDFGIAITPLFQQDVEELPLYYEPMVAFVPPGHRLSKQKTVSEKDLEAKDILLLEEGHCFRNSVLSICKTLNKNEAEEDILHVDSGSFNTLIKLAKDGFGMTVLPALQAEELQEENQQLLKEFTKPVPTREVSIIYQSSQLRLRFVEELQKLIQSVVRGKIFLESDNRTLPNIQLP